MSDDRIVERDELGRIKKAKLTPEQASEMGKASAEARFKTEATSEGLLKEAGYNDDDNPAPVYASVMAQQAIKSNQAMRDWRKFTGTHDADTGNAPEENNCPYYEHCLLFKSYEGTITPREIKEATERIRARRERQQKP